MNPQITTLGRSQSAVLSTNKVVKNTYMLLLFVIDEEMERDGLDLRLHGETVP